MTDVTMPRLAEGMEQGTILRWLVADGASIEPGAELVEIESDKATITHAAEAAGTVRFLAAEGDTVPVGEPIARIGAGAELPPAVRAAAPVPITPKPSDGQRRLIATPLARRVAAVHDVELDGLVGSGLGGRITKVDVLAAAGIAPASPAPRPPGVDGRRVRPSRLQRIVAERMTAAKATVPHFQVQTEVAFDAALTWRGELKAAAGDRAVPSVNDLLVRACALALAEHPLLNGSFVDGDFQLHDRVHLGIAIAVDDGLVVATIRDADIKSIGTVARESRRLVERVRSGDATAEELTGATFTVSNLGMFGMTAITPVINPPQAAILGVGAARDVLARAGEEIVDRKLLTLTLSCDHRIVNGADASRFLSDVRALLETPLQLAL